MRTDRGLWYREDERDGRIDLVPVDGAAMTDTAFRHRWQIVTELPGGARVSTVFLALDHAYLPGGPPMLYETMVFGGPVDQTQKRYRYSTRAEAEIGHAKYVEQAKDALAGAVAFLPDAV